LSSKKIDSYFISAGEHSGDLLGADLVLALREKMPKLTAFGVTGSAMQNAGVEEIASIDELSVMGVVEVARKLPQLKMLETRLLHWIDQWDPKFAVLIDNPGFHLRLAEQLKMRGVRVFQYVAPKIWAWGESRAPQIRDAFDMVLGILPFEEAFFRERGIPYTYVGSPLKDRIDKVMIRRESLGLPMNRPVVACLPGSRPSEIRLNLPTLQAVRKLIARDLPDALFVVPVSQNLSIEDMTSALAFGGVQPVATPLPAGGELAVESWECEGLRFVAGMSLELMAAADAAIVASGTATLECALLGTPLVVVYKMNEFTYQIAKRAVKVAHVSLVNLMAGRGLVREFIQDFAPAEVAAEVLSLLRDQAKRKAIRDSFDDIRERLKGAAADSAASVITGFMGGDARPPGGGW
jgi:lipid-A-disaccharide synthase